MILKLTPAVVSLAKRLPTEKSAPVLFDTDTYEFYSPDDEIPSTVLRETLVDSQRFAVSMCKGRMWNI